MEAIDTVFDYATGTFPSRARITSTQNQVAFPELPIQLAFQDLLNTEPALNKVPKDSWVALHITLSEDSSDEDFDKDLDSAFRQLTSNLLLGEEIAKRPALARAGDVEIIGIPIAYLQVALPNSDARFANARHTNATDSDTPVSDSGEDGPQPDRLNPTLEQVEPMSNDLECLIARAVERAVQKQNGSLKREVHKMLSDFESKILSRIAELDSGNKPTSDSAPMTNSSTLPPVADQRVAEPQTLAEMANVSGRGKKAQRSLQNLLRRLEGAVIKQDFVEELQLLLKERQWGIACTKCETPAAPRWKPDSNYVAGGRMQFSHTGPDGKTAIHGSHTVLPKLTVVARPDRRRATSS